MKGEKEPTKTQNQVENWLNENSLSAKNMMLICAYIQRKGLKVPHNTHFKNKSKGTFESFKTWFETPIFRIGDVVELNDGYLGCIDSIDKEIVYIKFLARPEYVNNQKAIIFKDTKMFGFDYMRYNINTIKHAPIFYNNLLLDSLETKGWVWDKEDKTFRIKINNQWKPKTLDYYYLVDDCLNVVTWKTSNLDIIDRRIKSNNYFRTEQAAQEAANKFQEILKTLPKE